MRADLLVGPMSLIPASVRTIEQLDDWISGPVQGCVRLSDRLRLAAAVIERAAEIGAHSRAERPA